MKRLIRKDTIGLYIATARGTYRPGDVRGYAHAYEMGDAGLKEGDTVIGHLVDGAPLIRLKRIGKTGGDVYWAEENHRR